MSSLALALVLLAALIHAGWNLLAKRTGGDARFAFWASAAVAVLWAPVGLWYTWRDAGQYGPLQWALLCASGVIHVAYFVTLLRGYRLGDLSVVYPLARGTGPLLTASAATVLLDERLGPLGWTGVLGVVMGVGLIAGGFTPWRRWRDATIDAGERRRLRAGVAYGLLTGAFIAGYSVVDGYAVKRAGVSPILVDYLGNLFRLPVNLLLLRSMGAATVASLPAYGRAMWKPVLAIGFISPVAYVMVLFAATMAPLSHVAPAREVSMLFAALMGGTLLNERDAGVRLLGAACIAGGVIALASAG